MSWPQNYTPLGGGFLSTLVAAVPVVVLLGLLGLAHWRAHWAALAGLASALAVAVFAFKMPAEMALASGLWRGVRAFPDRVDRAERDFYLPALSRDGAVCGA